MPLLLFLKLIFESFVCLLEWVKSEMTLQTEIHFLCTAGTGKQTSVLLVLNGQEDRRLHSQTFSLLGKK